jgi:hypothetical protein
MGKQALFAGLVFDERDQPAEVVFIGEEPCYVVNDAGFRRHIPSELVDRQVFQHMADLIQGNEDVISEQTAKMLGQDDPFSKAAIENQLKNLDQQFNNLLSMGIPEEMRAYMGMMGMRIRINVHGEVLDVEQPGLIDNDGE